jgi:glutamyl-tRNA synthetase
MAGDSVSTPHEKLATVGRLAPSPTGRLHVGHARTFLLAFWRARSKGGRIVMRLEDLDGPRVRPGMSDTILSDLEWLGIDWDGPPFVQSRGIDAIREAARELVAKGVAYACVCTRADLRSAQSAPQAGDVEPRYPGTCRDRFASLAAARAEREAGLRFRVPDGEVEIADGVAGPRRFDVQAQIGDFLIARRDGAPAYQLAVVVDDARQGVTEIVRGDDLLPSAARQWHLQRALGLAHPAWFHVPLVADEQGRRLAKRADDVSLAELRERGVDPRAIVGWAARSAGQDVPARVTAAEVTSVFDLARLPRTPVTLASSDVAELRDAR